MNLLGDGAKPWKAVLSSDGLSDVGTPIFCLRRGKSAGVPCDFGMLTDALDALLVFRQATIGSGYCQPSGSSNPSQGPCPCGKL